MSDQTTRAVFLTAYPEGAPDLSNFAVRELPMPAAGAGEMLCRTVWMSVDPYMRGRMMPNVKSYIPPFKLDAPMEGGAVSQVVASHIDGFSPGDYVVDFTGGWKEHYVSTGEGAQKVSPEMAPLSAFLGVLGMPGLTAWGGMTKILDPQAGETVFVSGAAGAVGSLACQLAKLRGCRVIASAGSPEKCAWLEEEAGVDVAINYKDHGDASALTEALTEAAPEGVTCYFENVGGMHLEAALNCLETGGRIAICGMIARYNDQGPQPGPSNLINLVSRRINLRGFLVSEFFDKGMEFAADVAPLLAAGKIKFREATYEGLEAAPEAFLGLFKGENFGKAVVRVSHD
ncbi:MAG: NADP-dependent oxidoreductase [Pseudomonadota bacterium]